MNPNTHHFPDVLVPMYTDSSGKVVHRAWHSSITECTVEGRSITLEQIIEEGERE
jgi:hypothetical protein